MSQKLNATTNKCNCKQMNAANNSYRYRCRYRNATNEQKINVGTTQKYGHIKTQQLNNAQPTTCRWPVYGTVRPATSRQGNSQSNQEDFTGKVLYVLVARAGTFLLVKKAWIYYLRCRRYRYVTILNTLGTGICTGTADLHGNSTATGLHTGARLFGIL